MASLLACCILFAACQQGQKRGASEDNRLANPWEDEGSAVAASGDEADEAPLPVEAEEADDPLSEGSDVAEMPQGPSPAEFEAMIDSGLLEMAPKLHIYVELQAPNQPLFRDLLMVVNASLKIEAQHVPLARLKTRKRCSCRVELNDQTQSKVLGMRLVLRTKAGEMHEVEFEQGVSGLWKPKAGLIEIAKPDVEWLVPELRIRFDAYGELGFKLTSQAKWGD